MRKRLSLVADLYPVASFFNGLKDREFPDVLEQFVQGRGCNPEDLSCVFPEGLSEDEGGPQERFGCIEFWTYAGNQEVRISFSDFLLYLTEAVHAQIGFQPDKEADFKAQLLKISQTISRLENEHINFLKSHSA